MQSLFSVSIVLLTNTMRLLLKRKTYLWKPHNKNQTINNILFNISVNLANQIHNKIQIITSSKPAIDFPITINRIQIIQQLSNKGTHKVYDLTEFLCPVVSLI